MSDFLFERWSFSKCMDAAKCLRKFFLRRVARVRADAAPWLLGGRAVHAGQEADNRAKIAGESLPVVAVHEAAVEALKKYSADEGVKTDVDRFAIEHGRQLEVFEESGERAKIRPVPGSVEAAFEMDLMVGDSESGLKSAVLEGFVDVVSADETDQRTLVDYKTAGRPTSQNEAKAHVQLALEAEGAKAHDSKIVTFVKHAKQKPTAKVTEPVANTKENFERAIKFVADQIHAARRAMVTGDFPKCDPAAVHCQWGKQCEYGAICFTTNDLKDFVEVKEIRPVGTVPTPEWRK